MLLAYGQTGSGKTFTVKELERLVAKRLMDREVAGKWDVHICIFEVAGSNMYGELLLVHMSISMASTNHRHEQISSKIANRSRSWKIPSAPCSS